MRLIITFLFMANVLFGQQTIYIKSKVDLTIRKAPEPAKQVNWTEQTNKISSQLQSIEMSREQRKAQLETLTSSGKNVILEYTTLGYSSDLNEFQNKVQNKVSSQIDYYHSQLINGYLNPDEYPAHIDAVVSNYFGYVKSIENFNVSLKNKIDSCKYAFDQKKINLISDELSKVLNKSEIYYSNSIIEGRRYLTFSKQSLNFKHNGKTLTVNEFNNLLYSTFNVKDNSYESIMKEAINYHNSQEYNNSLNSFLTASKQNSNDSLYVYISREYYYMNDYSNGIIFSQKAIDLNEINDLAYFWKALSEIELLKYSEALKSIDFAILLSPKNTKYYFERARLKSKLNDLKGALEDYNKILSINPNDENAHKYKVITQEKLK